jgi:hypothetical protein
MISTEGWHARRAANFYGPEAAGLPRAARIDFARQRIAAVEDAEAQRRTQLWADHKQDCAECRGGGFCIWRFATDQEGLDVSALLSFLSEVVRAEEADAQYAARARDAGVDYRRHLESAYWQNLTQRKFVLVARRCERCGQSGKLEGHHRHYETLGYERLEDIEALCRQCHQREPRY